MLSTSICYRRHKFSLTVSKDASRVVQFLRSNTYITNYSYRIFNVHSYSVCHSVGNAAITCATTCPPGHVSTWSRVHLVTCPPGHVSTWSRVHLVTCPPGHVSTWSRVHLVTCPPGHVSTWSRVHLVTCPPGHVSTWSRVL